MWCRATTRHTASRRSCWQHRDVLDARLDAVVVAVKDAIPEYGVDVAVDGSDMPAYANGQKYIYKGGPLREKFSDTHAKDCELPEVPILLDIAKRRGVVPATAALDKNLRRQEYLRRVGRPQDSPGHRLDRHGDGEARRAQAPDVRARDVDVRGRRRQARRERNGLPREGVRAALPVAPVLAVAPPIPHGTERHKALYRGRTAVEREFGRLKNDGGLTPLRVRGLDRVSLHADLTILTILASALARARAVALAA